MSKAESSFWGAMKPGLKWGVYDVANSGYYVIYAAAVLPLFLRQKIFSGDPAFEAKWGLAQGVAVLFGLILSILLSRFTDRRDQGRYWALAKHAFVVPALLSLLLVLLVGLGASPIVWLLSFALVHGVYLASLTFYDASLVDVSSGTRRIEISGWAWGFGYLGGVVCLVLYKVLETSFGEFAWQAFLTASLFYVVASILAARLVIAFRPVGTSEATSQRKDLPPSESLISTSNLAAMLGSMILIVDGIAIFITYMSLYWSSLRFSNDQILVLLLILQLLSFPFSGLISMLARKGIVLFLLICGSVWLVSGLTAAYAPGFEGALAAVILVSTVLGGSQAVLRTIFSEVTIPERRLFGFSVFALVEKGAAFVGPVIAGLAINTFGFRPVLILSATAILVGCLGLARVTRLIATYALKTDLAKKAAIAGS